MDRPRARRMVWCIAIRCVSPRRPGCARSPSGPASRQLKSSPGPSFSRNKWLVKPALGLPKFWGFTNGQPVAAFYDMDRRITGSPDYQTDLVKGLRALPSLSIIADLDNLVRSGARHLRQSDGDGARLGTGGLGGNDLPRRTTRLSDPLRPPGPRWLEPAARGVSEAFPPVALQEAVWRRAPGLSFVWPGRRP